MSYGHNMFGPSQAVKEEVGAIWRQAGLDVWEEYPIELAEWSEANGGNRFLPDVNPANGVETYVILRKNRRPPADAYGTAAHWAISGVWARWMDRLRDDRQLDIFQKSMAFRQAVTAAALMYPVFIDPQAKNECERVRMELLGKMDLWKQSWQKRQ